MQICKIQAGQDLPGIEFEDMACPTHHEAGVRWRPLYWQGTNMVLLQELCKNGGMLDIIGQILNDMDPARQRKRCGLQLERQS